MSAANESGAASGPEEPFFRVVRGTPTDVELAALSVVLAARMHPAEIVPTPPSSGPSAWSRTARAPRRPLVVGRDAWRLSARAGWV